MISVGLSPLIEWTFRYAYVLATLKRDEMIGEGRGVEAETFKIACELQDTLLATPPE